MARLRIAYTDGSRTDVELSGQEATIGRDASCDVTLTDAITSRQHARLYRDAAGQFWIQDLNSKNGTLVNDALVSSARVLAGDRIGIGACVLTLEDVTGPSVVVSDAATDQMPVAASAWGTQQRLDLPRRRLEKLYELNERLTGRLDRDALLHEVLDICIESLRFERAGVAIWAGDTKPLEWVYLRNLGDVGKDEFRISRSLVERALHQAERILVNDSGDEAIDPTASMISYNIRSAMCVPIEFHGKVRGVMYGDRTSSTGGYTREDIDFFAALGRLGAMGLANVQLVEEIKARQRVEMQLSWARDIQSRLFPDTALELPGLTIDALNDPGQTVSGDYYDFFVREDGLVVIVAADVSGKGVPASLLMANLQAGVHVTFAHETDVVEGVKRLNKLICRNVSDARFITGIIGLLDPATRRFRCVNAGHLTPYLLDASGEVLKLTLDPDLPLGIEADFAYQEARIDLGSEPVTMFLYSDGIPEAENEQGEQFGEERLAAALAAVGPSNAAELTTRIRRSIKQFTRSRPPTDDITMVVLKLE